MGFWDNINQIHEINLDEIEYESFSYLIPKTTRRASDENGRDSINQTPIPLQPTEEEQHELEEEEAKQRQSHELEGDEAKQRQSHEGTPEEQHEESKSDVDSNSVREFDGDIHNKQSTDESNEPRPSNEESSLDRSNSRSKEFREKIDNELDKTLEMIAENLGQVD